MAKSIALLNLYKLRKIQPDALSILVDCKSDYDWNSFLDCQTLFPWAYFYSRTGNNIWPFSNKIVDILDYNMPAYDSLFDKSFSEVTDNRCYELMTRLSTKPWLIAWSGGVDSTTVLTSLLKNYSPTELKDFAVYCNTTSIWENPKFFHEYIKPNFKLIDSSNGKPWEHFADYFVIDGEPADCLWGQPNMFRFNHCHDWSWEHRPDYLIKWLTDCIGNTKSAVWFYEQMKHNIKSVNIPIINYKDWFWWINFNHAWIVSTTRNMETNVTIKEVLHNHIHWYDSVDYQLWSMNNNHSGEKYDSGVQNYKKAAKEYIFDLTKNSHARWLKTKLKSTGNRPPIVSWLAISNDLTYIDTIDDRKQLTELLITHIQN